jgi:hypothetical protein
MQHLTDGFTAMAIEDMDEVIPSRGATSGLLNPSGIAKHYCGLSEFAVGNIMAYGFRRFGYPVNGWDDYKQLCQWVIRTPMQDVFLSLQPTTSEPFGYLLKDPLSQTLSNEQIAPLVEWGKQCQEWAKETYSVTLVHRFHYAGHCTDEELLLAWNNWKDKAAEVQTERFFAEKQSECERLVEEYKTIRPSPNRHHSSHILDEEVPDTPPYWTLLPADSLERRINEALHRTILDMKRPVSIRDWQIDILGKCSGEGFRVFKEDEDGYEEITQDYFAPVTKTAGLGLAELCRQ